MLSKIYIFFVLGIVCVVFTLSCASESSLKKKDVNPSTLPTKEIESSKTSEGHEREDTDEQLLFGKGSLSRL